MTDNILHTIDFVTGEQYRNDEHSAPLHTVSAWASLPMPEPGDHVTFGWYEVDGERQSRVHWQNEPGHMDSSAEYVRSREYVVMVREQHYHNRHTVNDDGGTMTDRIEVGTTVVVRPLDADEREDRLDE